ncbi:MAG: 23S rRNA (pseudouridine(1915)-N(3))-methyltransferase RlmH [Acidobacteria bacterium]|nr:23S rRNA (pseudouridine(1915)-N(3))-methyltransferase RlmH [Acidobacteriota bacterium]
MKLVLVWVGRVRDPRWRALQEDYLARLEKFAPVEVIAVKEPRQRGALQVRRKSGEWLQASIPPASTVVALDEAGEELSSAGLADFLGRLLLRGTRAVTFVLGGPYGLSDELRRQADLVLSLSRMTWTHEASRVLLLEQLYRAFTILRGYPYHK